MKLEPESAASMSEFDLPDRVRELLSRILWELIQTCQQKLKEADGTLKTRLDELQTKLDGVKSWAESAKQHHRDLRKRNEARIEAALAELEQIWKAAEEHLQSQGVQDLPPHPSSPAATAGAVSMNEEDIKRAFAPVQARLAAIKEFKQVSYWPSSVGARWTIALASLVLLVVFYPLVLAWPAIVLTLRLSSRRRAADGYSDFADSALSLQGSLETARSQVRRQYEKDIAAVEEKVPPAVKEHAEAASRARSNFERTAQSIAHTAGTLAKELHD